METNNIIKDKSNDRQIENQRARTWEEYCKKMRGKYSYFYDDFIIRPETFGSAPILSEFADKEDLEAFIAYSNLLKLRKDWIGDWNPDWTSDDIKFTIIIENNHIVGFINRNVSRPMSFPTREMRNEFIVTFKDLLEQAKSLL